MARARIAAVRDPLLLLIAATIGVISPSGNEVGPFLAVEQASLTQRLPADRRTSVLAWYNLAGQVASAVGALAAGLLAQMLLPAARPRSTAIGRSSSVTRWSASSWRPGSCV